MACPKEQHGVVRKAMLSIHAGKKVSKWALRKGVEMKVWHLS
jgi:hypothetical protein